MHADSEIGFIGLGNMGYPMALNLIKHGFRLRIHSRNMNSQNVKNLIQQGAASESSPMALGEKCEFVLLSLPSAEATKEVVLGKTGLIKAMKPDTVVVETSTVPPSTVKEIAIVLSQKNIHVLDAPVSGGRVRAEKAELTIMVGGEHDIYLKTLPILQAIGNKIYYVGDLGSGEAVKLLNSFLAISALLCARDVCEAAVKMDMNLNLLHEIISNSTGASWIWNNWVATMLKKTAVKSTARIALKDLNYARQLAKDLGVNTECIDLMISRLSQLLGAEDKDLSEMVTVLLK